jgi:hypothetical protein
MKAQPVRSRRRTWYEPRGGARDRGAGTAWSAAESAVFPAAPPAERRLLPIIPFELRLEQPQELCDSVRLPLADGLVKPLQTLADPGADSRSVRQAGRFDRHIAGDRFEL